MDTFKSINTYPMQNSPMMNMPNPAAFSVHGLRTHSYSSLIGATMMINAFDMCGGEPTLSIACNLSTIVVQPLRPCLRSLEMRSCQRLPLRAGGGQAQYQNRHTDTEIAWFGSEASELVGAQATYFCRPRLEDAILSAERWSVRLAWQGRCSRRPTC